eukprot:c560_g1_i1 orf=3-293(-)
MDKVSFSYCVAKRVIKILHFTQPKLCIGVSISLLSTTNDYLYKCPSKVFAQNKPLQTIETKNLVHLVNYLIPSPSLSLPLHRDLQTHTHRYLHTHTH